MSMIVGHVGMLASFRKLLVMHEVQVTVTRPCFPASEATPPPCVACRAQHTAGALWDPRMLLELQQVRGSAESLSARL